MDRNTRVAGLSTSSSVLLTEKAGDWRRLARQHYPSSSIYTYYLKSISERLAMWSDKKKTVKIKNYTPSSIPQSQWATPSPCRGPRRHSNPEAEAPRCRHSSRRYDSNPSSRCRYDPSRRSSRRHSRSSSTRDVRLYVMEYNKLRDERNKVEHAPPSSTCVVSEVFSSDEEYENSTFSLKRIRFPLESATFDLLLIIS